MLHYLTRIPILYSFSLLLTLLALVVAAVTFTLNLRDAMERVERQALTGVTEQMAALQGVLENQVLREEYSEVRRLFSGIAVIPTLEQGWLTSPQGEVVVATDRLYLDRSVLEVLGFEERSHLRRAAETLSGQVALTEEGESLIAIYPISFWMSDQQLRSHEVGFFIQRHNLIDLRVDAMHAEIRRSLSPIAIFTLALFATGIAVYYRFQRRLHQIIIATRRLSAGDLSARAEVEGSDEVAQLAQAVDAMAREVEASQLQLATLYSKETLTDLPNRQKLLDDLVICTAPVVTVVNIDRFSEINDFYGYDIGDEVIIEMARRIKHELIGREYALYHMRGDEFVILADAPPRGKYLADMRQILQAVQKREFQFSGASIPIDISGGCSFVDSKRRLLTTATIALKEARRDRHQLQLYSESTYSTAAYQENLLWTSRLRTAIESDRVMPYFQPIYDLKKGVVNKFECLMRLRNEDGSVVAPDNFIEVARRAKLYPRLTRTMIEKSIAVFADTNYQFSLNVTADDVRNRELMSYLLRNLRMKGVGPRFILEIVESESIESFDEALELIRLLKELGCRLAIDDFGTGYSNFEYLMKLDTDFVKIDGSLIRDLVSNPNSRAVVEVIVNFARKMEIYTVAEFVHDEATAIEVKKLGIDFAQGYYFGRPAPFPVAEGVVSVR